MWGRWPGQERPERTTVPVPAATVLSGGQIHSGFQFHRGTNGTPLDSTSNRCPSQVLALLDSEVLKQSINTSEFCSQRSSSQSRARLTAFFQRVIRRSRSPASICGSKRLPSCHCPAISSVLCQ